MTDINKVIEINITRDDVNISRENFGILLGIAPHVAWRTYTKEYSNLRELGADFPSDSKIYLWAEKVFSQNPKVPFLKVGRRQVDSIDIEVVTALDNTDYTTTINDVPFVYNSGSSATPISIAGGLVNLINLGAEPVTAVDNTDGTYTLNADVSGVVFSAVVDSRQKIDQLSLIAVNTIVDDVKDLQEEDNAWYVIDEFNHIENDQETLAAYIETQQKLYAIYNDDPNLVLEDYLHQQNYDRSFVMHTKTDNAGSDYIEGAWCGLQLTTDPGSSTWANKTLRAIEADNYSGADYDAILAKKANLYTIFSDVLRPMTRNGTVASGEYIDIIRGIDWFTARLRERLFVLLNSSPKIPYTNHGITLVVNAVRAEIQAGIEEGLIDPDSRTYYVTAPKVVDIDPQDRIDRILRDVEFQWRAAGAIHTLIVNGRVTF